MLGNTSGITETKVNQKVKYQKALVIPYSKDVSKGRVSRSS